MANNTKIVEIALDPKWTFGHVMLGDAKVRFIEFEHPRHGNLTFHLSDDSIATLRKLLGAGDA